MCIVCVKIVSANSLNGTNAKFTFRENESATFREVKNKSEQTSSYFWYLLYSFSGNTVIGKKKFITFILWGSIFPLSNLWPWPSMTFLRSPLPTLSLQGASQHIEATFDQKSIRKQIKLNFSWLPFSLFCIITESLDVFESTGKPINRWLSIIFCKVLMLSVCSAVEKNNGWGDVWHDHHGWHYGNSFADFWASTSIAAVLRLLHHAETMMLTFLLCHMLGVSSSCTNPVLYGFLNDNFVKAGANTEISSNLKIPKEY